MMSGLTHAADGPRRGRPSPSALTARPPPPLTRNPTRDRSPRPAARRLAAALACFAVDRRPGRRAGQAPPPRPSTSRSRTSTASRSTWPRPTRARSSWSSTPPASAATPRSTRAWKTIYEQVQGQGLRGPRLPGQRVRHQEPGSNGEIKSFCSTKYNVTFPLFSKIVVKGPGIHPFYEYLTSPKTDPKFAGDITWNFNKFLINRKGEVIARFDSGDEPESAKVTKAIEAALAESK